MSIPAFGSFTDNGGGSGSVAFTPGLDNAGSYTIQLIATDNGTPNLNDTLSFSLTVNDVNRAPVFAAVSAQSMNENSSLPCRFPRQMRMATDWFFRIESTGFCIGIGQRQWHWQYSTDARI
ncbi:MAG: hypothetical protein R3C26_20565 [Calditrichia bacterium]